MASKKKPAKPVDTSVSDLEKKLKRINELRAQFNKMHDLYAEHDSLVEDVLPLFISKTADGFFIRTSVQFGTTVVSFSPSFYDTKKAKLVAKSWKSVAFEPGRIG